MKSLYRAARYLRVAKTRYEKETGEKYDELSSEILKKYLGQDNVSFTFATLPKLGIFSGSAKSEDSKGMPVGIYGYPLNKSTFDQHLSNSLPFAGERPYIFIYKLNGETLSSDTYSMDKFRADYDKLMGKEEELIHIPYQQNPYQDNDLADLLQRERGMGSFSSRRVVVKKAEYEAFEDFVGQNAGLTPLNMLWVLLKEITNNSTDFNSKLRQLGYKHILDNGTGSLFEGIPSQTLSLSMADIEVLEGPIKNLHQWVASKEEVEEGAYYYQFSGSLDEIKASELWKEKIGSSFTMPKDKQEELLSKKASPENIKRFLLNRVLSRMTPEYLAELVDILEQSNLLDQETASVIWGKIRWLPGTSSAKIELRKKLAEVAGVNAYRNLIPFATSDLAQEPGNKEVLQKIRNFSRSPDRLFEAMQDIDIESLHPLYVKILSKYFPKEHPAQFWLITHPSIGAGLKKDILSRAGKGIQEKLIGAGSQIDLKKISENEEAIAQAILSANYSDVVLLEIIRELPANKLPKIAAAVFLHPNANKWLVANVAERLKDTKLNNAVVKLDSVAPGATKEEILAQFSEMKPEFPKTLWTLIKDRPLETQVSVVINLGIPTIKSILNNATISKDESAKPLLEKLRSIFSAIPQWEKSRRR